MTTTVQAGWTLVSEAVDHGKFYLDFATLKKTANGWRIWHLRDLKKPDSDGDRSIKALEEYDCQDEKSRVLQACGYPRPMGQGTPKCDTATSPSAWEYPIPDSIGEVMLKAACTAAGFPSAVDNQPKEYGTKLPPGFVKIPPGYVLDKQ